MDGATLLLNSNRKKEETSEREREHKRERIGGESGKNGNENNMSKL